MSWIYTGPFSYDPSDFKVYDLEAICNAFDYPSELMKKPITKEDKIQYIISNVGQNAIVMPYKIEDVDSTLIKDIEYNPDTRELRVSFRRYYVDELTHVDVPFNYFEELSSPTGKSHGRFYLEMIKKKFKLKHTHMAENKRRTVNKASNEKRFLKMRLNVLKFNKDWFFQGEEGVYTDITLALLPDGTLDKFGNLGMVTQDVPSDVYKQGGKDIKGEILGNGLEWERKPAEGQPGSTAIKPGLKDGVMDDLPF